MHQDWEITWDKDLKNLLFILSNLCFREGQVFVWRKSELRYAA